jgi:hypothetical protein
MAAQYEHLFRELISARHTGAHSTASFEEGRVAAR